MQTAGSVAKRPVPYHPNAPRNRLKSEPPKRSDASQIDFKAEGVVNTTIYPYRVISRTVQESTVVPLEARVGFTNSDICAGMARREHAKLFSGFVEEFEAPTSAT